MSPSSSYLDFFTLSRDLHTIKFIHLSMKLLTKATSRTRTSNPFMHHPTYIYSLTTLTFPTPAQITKLVYSLYSTSILSSLLMALPYLLRATFILLILLLLSFANTSYGARKLFSLYQPPPMVLKYHNGALLEGDLHVSILWYGKFSPAQKSIIVDFLLSLNPSRKNASPKVPTVSHWWQTVETYMKKAGKKQTNIILAHQVADENCSMGKSLKKSHIRLLADRANLKRGGLTLVLTSEGVGVEGFCMSNCGYHGWEKGEESVFIWVGNSVTQCPGQCAWPFHQPIYGPQTKPLGAPNDDVGTDGMVVNIASLMAEAVTNPFGNGYFQGSAGAPLEAASACPGLYGKGAYPGYAGELLLDKTSGASYNALGVNGRKYLLPALFDPNTSRCSTIV